ncbi:MAG TPA: GAF domain-containing protein [Pseudonocardiaceae bacterium]|jgi:signal transduction histidine kinase|nr:GAF domain-containing protein [Pseudonocardiaceae bacterium]
MASEDDADLRRLRHAVLGLGDDPRLAELVDIVTALVVRSRRRELWLEASHDITRTLLTAAGPTSTLRLVAERARELASAPVAAIALPDPARPANLVFEVVDGIGMDAEKLTGVSVPIDETGTGQVFRTGRSEIFPRYGFHILARSDDPDQEFPPRIAELDSMLAVPLAVGAEVRGVLVLARLAGDVPFGSADIELAEAFAAQAALALEIGRAEEDRQRLAVLTDRDRIARDLHDVVVQRLFAIGLGLRGLGRIALGETVAEQIAGLVGELDQTVRDVRQSIFALHEVTDGMARLRAELMRATEEAATALGFAPRIEFAGPLDSLVPDPVRPDLLASLRESLSNVARHAAATQVSVQVSVDRAGQWLTLVIADNGVGMPAVPGRRSGLTNLAERARRWGGKLHLEQPADGGTRLRWTVPLSPSPSSPSPSSQPPS